MRLHLYLALVVLIPVVSAGAEVSDTPESRHDAAERYAKVADVRKPMADSVEAVSQSIPSERREAFRTLMTKHLRIEVLEAAMIAAMEKHFTTSELNALADFYGSEVGRSAMAKFGAYMGDVMPLLQLELDRAAAELQRDAFPSSKPSGT